MGSSGMKAYAAGLSEKFAYAIGLGRTAFRGRERRGELCEIFNKRKKIREGKNYSCLLQ